MSVTTLDMPLSVATQRWNLPLLTVFALWVLILFDPHLWLAPAVLGPIPKFIYLGLAVMILLHAPGREWYLPFLTLIIGALISSLFAENIGIAQDLIVKILLLYYILAIASLTYITSTDKSMLLLHLFLLQFLWWALHGDLAGRVGWHPTLGNEDGFGPMMVIGMGYCYYFAMGTRKRTLRLGAFFLSGLSLIGVVSSFARGAVLAAGVVAAYVWFRSPRKGRTLAAVMLGFGVVVFAASILFPGGAFWEEMSTISEGFGTGTGLDRKILWEMAWQEFLENPILGVGGGNFGIYASMYLWSEVLPGYRSHWLFYGRAVHSLYFQILAEFGIVGTIAFVALLIDFWKRNAELRSVSFITAWWSATHHGFDLRMLSRALEVAMVGYLASGFFFDQLYVHWFYSILTVNAVLHSNAKRVALQEQRSPSSE